MCSGYYLFQGRNARLDKSKSHLSGSSYVELLLMIDCAFWLVMVV